MQHHRVPIIQEIFYLLNICKSVSSASRLTKFYFMILRLFRQTQFLILYNLFLKVSIYLCDCAGSSLQHDGFLQLRQEGLLPSPAASSCSGVSRSEHGPQALGLSSFLTTGPPWKSYSFFFQGICNSFSILSVCKCIFSLCLASPDHEAIAESLSHELSTSRKDHKGESSNILALNLQIRQWKLNYHCKEKVETIFSICFSLNSSQQTIGLYN